MPKFCANLSMLFNEVDFLDRFKAASDAGFEGVEYLFPYDFDKDVLVGKLEENNLTQVLHNLPAGDWGAGERGIAVLPDRVEEFKAGVDQAIEYATALGCKQVNCLAGIPTEGVSAEEAEKTFVSNLVFAAAKLKEAGIRLLIEPINTRDIPGFFLTTTQQARDIITKVGSDNLFIQYDIYHMQIMEGDVSRSMSENLDLIRHLQLADNPGRNEPGTGELNYPFLFDFIDGLDGFEGWIGCEYKPATTTVEGLGWFKAATSKSTLAAE